MRKAFLAVGLICSFLAFAIIFRQIRDFDPRSMLGGGWKAKPQLHGNILTVKFSADGEKLLIRVRDDSGRNLEADTFIYSLSNGAIRKAPVGRHPNPSRLPWSPDSRLIAFYERNACKVVDIATGSVVQTFRIGMTEWSPDGKYQLFRNDATRDAYLRNVADGDWTVLPKEFGDARLIWSRDCKFLLCFDWDTKDIMRYRTRNGEVTKLASLTGYHKRLFALLVPSPHSDHAYFTTPPPNTDYRQNAILHRLDIRSGKIETIFDPGLDPDNSALGRIYLPRDEKHIYFGRHDRVGDDRGNEEWRRSLIKLDIATGETEILYKGSHLFRDYSAVKDIFLLCGKDLKSLYLFDVATRALDQIYPPE